MPRGGRGAGSGGDEAAETVLGAAVGSTCGGASGSAQSLGSPGSHETSTGRFGSCGTRLVGATRGPLSRWPTAHAGVSAD
ncbi:hypothetical protein B5F44_11560 [Gordonibacter urolithinfaciens]|nr:hypothetical protein B5F44_11560 [Gordonibacter urolithinfaciens]